MKKAFAICVWLFAVQHIVEFTCKAGTPPYYVNLWALGTSLLIATFLTIPVLGYVFFGRGREA